MSDSKPRVVVSHWVHDEVCDYLAEFSDPVSPTRSEGIWPRKKLLELASDADGLVACMADTIDAEFLQDCPRLRVVSATLKGYDNFDVEACSRQGAWLTIVPDILIAPTAELTVGLMIGLMRRIAEGHDYVRSGGFSGWRPEMYGSTLQDATVGLIGLGSLGQALARKLKGFDAKLVYFDQQRLAGETERALAVSYLDLDRLVETSNTIVMLLPLTDSTRQLVDAPLIGRMRRGSFLINVGRGSVVVEEAVADALETGHLGGYAADVFAMEDWASPGHPARIPERLLRHPRTLFTPHLGSAVDDARRAMSMEAVRQVRQALDGQRPDHAVNEPTG